jgi:hypothetical protein
MFVVNSVISGDEITVTPDWLWGGVTGNKVVVFGYTTPQVGMNGYEFARNKLNAILLGKVVELRNPTFIPHLFGYEKLVCSVYLDGVDIANYFPEFIMRNPGFIPG